MTRTETDLRRAVAVPDDTDAIARLTSFAVSLGTETPGATAERTGGSPDRRRRWVLPLAAAASVLALVAGLGTVLSGGRDGGSPPAGADGAMTAEQLRPTWSMRFDPVAGYTVRNVSAYSVGPARGTLATVQATSTARPETGFVTTTPCPEDELCGKFPTSAPTRVTIGDARGSFWPGSRVEPGQLTDAVYRKPWQAAVESNDRQPQLVWRAAGQTVLITGTFGFDPTTYTYDAAKSEATMLRLARAVAAGRHDDITAPLALRKLPAHLAPEAVQLRDGSSCIGYGTGAGPYPGAATGSVLTACRVTTGRDDGATLQSAGLASDSTGRYAITDVGDGTSLVVALDRSHAALVDQAGLERLVRDADHTPRVADPATWLVVR